MSLGFIHVVTNGFDRFLPVLWLNNSPVCVCVCVCSGGQRTSFPLSIHSPTELFLWLLLLFIDQNFLFPFRIQLSLLFFVSLVEIHLFIPQNFDPNPLYSRHFAKC